MGNALDKRIGLIAGMSSINNSRTARIVEVNPSGRYKVALDSGTEIMATNASGISDLAVGNAVSLRLYGSGITTAEIAARSAKVYQQDTIYVWRRGTE
jgi:hypothetical protein